MGKRIAIYPDAFDPPCFGHLQMIRRAASVFDEVMIYIEPEKAPLLSLETRVSILRRELWDLDKLVFETGHFSPEAGNTYLILRPLIRRNDSDSERLRLPYYEAAFPGLEILYLPVAGQSAFLSRSAVSTLVELPVRPDLFFPAGTARQLEKMQYKAVRD